MERLTDHSACNYAWQQVTCDRCGRTYQCTPWDDYYCTDDDHRCEACLLFGVGITRFYSSESPIDSDH